MVRLGADILFCLPDLVSIKLLGSSAPIGSSNSFAGLGTGTGPPPTSNPGHIHPHSRVSTFHNVFNGGELGAGSESNDNELDDDFLRLDGEHGEGRLGASSSSAVPLRSAPSHTFSSFQSSRPGLLSWNPGSMSRRSASFSTASPSSSPPTFRSSVSSCSRRTGVSAKNQVRVERQNSNYKPEPSSPLSQAELGDYLIGWSRYCQSLRVVQIDHRWWWERRFVGDQWALHVCQEVARNKDKGKEREVSLFP